jgi:sarcosine oxidase subunit beta
MATPYDVVIVGGGNLGLWTAHQLAARGVGRIVVCERQWAGFGATTRSAGVVRQQGGSETAIKLGKWARELYLRLGDELGLGSGFTATGYYILAETEEEEAAFRELIALRRACGVPNDWVDADEGQRRFPSLRWEGFRGATFNPDDGYFHPPIVARNITNGVMRSGKADIYQHCEVTGIEERGGRYLVRTTRGDFETEKVVNAGGPRGARQLGEMVGVKVPVSAARHQIITFPTLGMGVTEFPLFFALAQGIYIRPEEQGALLGMSNPQERADTSGRYQIPYDWDYHETMQPVWEQFWPALRGQQVSRAWAASIDYTPDHLPIIDQPLPGYYVVTAGGHGMMWGPALGMKAAELVDTGAVSDLPADEINFARFSQPHVRRDSIALPFPEE